VGTAEKIMTTFTERAWTESSGLYGQILDLPFNRELAAGTLSQERFQFYITQDALYLTQYARALAAAAAKAPDIDSMRFFAKASETALIVERALHGGFFEKFGIDPAEAAAAEPSPACFGYTNFLLATAVTGGYAELTAAILPCFWFYWQVGKHIAGIARPGNPYQAWIDTYADPGFGEAVTTAIALTDRAAEGASGAEALAMLRAFKRSAQYEWMFWDSAYRREAWPVAVD
jgi:thiaminase/transcriptional activator TenA